MLRRGRIVAGVRTVVLGVLVALLLTPFAGAARDSPAATKRVVHSWSARLNAYDNAGAARLFARPAVFEQGGTALRLRSYVDIALWHSLLPCAGRIVSITVRGERATAVVVLANGRGRRCDAAGQKAAAVFRVRGGKILSWTQVPVPAPKGPTA
jgi:L-alanine-DL-glutamate epimerase-like enolase superfamily enzyme